MRTFEAKYPGTCVACGDRILIGDEITYTLSASVAHVRCEGEPATPARKAEVCGSCWLTKPCDCED